jgi:exoribonuclease-2
MPYLSQEVGNFSDEIINNKDNLSAAEAYQASRSFNRSKISTEPSLHAGLGLSSYIRVTSPMRRYLDMVVQQQLSRFINDLPTLDDSKIKARIKSVNLAMSKVNKATRQSIEHFKCLYLKQNKDWNGEGIIVEIRGDKALILIPKLAMMTQIKFKSKIELDEEVKIKVSSINLSERLIEFKPL